MGQMQQPGTTLGYLVRAGWYGALALDNLVRASTSLFLTVCINPFAEASDIITIDEQISDVERRT
jgi:hypothetical protein